MFGNSGKNLSFFDVGSENFAARYLIWMAMEGTRVKFPPELTNYLGRHGGQMLNLMREKCINQISPNTASSPNYMDHEVFNKVCFVNNSDVNDPSLAYDANTGKPVNIGAVEEWADKAAHNVGFAIFEFLNQSSQGISEPGNDRCEIEFPKAGVQKLSR